MLLCSEERAKTLENKMSLKEIFYILFRPESASLNRRSELFNTCRHRTQKLLEKAWGSRLSFLVQNISKDPQISHSSFPSDECGTFHMKHICKGYEYYLDLFNIILCKQKTEIKHSNRGNKQIRSRIFSHQYKNFFSCTKFDFKNFSF